MKSFEVKFLNDSKVQEDMNSNIVRTFQYNIINEFLYDGLRKNNLYYLDVFIYKLI